MSDLITGVITISQAIIILYLIKKYNEPNNTRDVNTSNKLASNIPIRKKTTTKRNIKKT